jgi:GntR family transcriptional regulator
MPRPSKIAANTVADQVAMNLKEAFLSGEYSNGEQLPSLAELAKEFGVSISSVREGVKKLEALELVEIVHGRGVFVRSAKIHWPGRFTNFSEMVRQWGKVPGAQVLESATLPAGDEVAAQLNLSAGASVHFLRRLRLADTEPLAIETSFLPAERFPTLLEVYRDPMSLYQLIQNEFDTRPIAGIQTLEAVLATDDDAALLGVSPGAPLLLVNTIAYDTDMIPVEYGSSLFRGDRYRYVVRLTR